jgi:hypothetical protein
MGQGWRVRVTFYPPKEGRRAVRKLREQHEREIAESIREQLGFRAKISLSVPDLFLYTDNRDAASVASGVVRDVLAGHSLRTTIRIDFWHPVRETWERVEEAALDTAAGDGAKAGGVPDDEELARLEQEHQKAVTWAQSMSGETTWEVRIQIPDHQACIEYAHRLNEAGHPVVRHRRYLLLGARSKGEANALARMIGQEGPSGSVVTTQLAKFTASSLYAVEMIDTQTAEVAEGLSDLESDVSDLRGDAADLAERGTTVVGVLAAGSSALHAGSDALDAGSDAVKLVNAVDTGESETAVDVSVADVGRGAATLLEASNTRESQIAADVLNLGSDVLEVTKDIAKLTDTGRARKAETVDDFLGLGSDLLHAGSDVLDLGSDSAKLVGGD